MKKELTITEFARMGGRARAKKLNKEKRSEIARKGAKAYWDKYPEKRKKKLST